ETFTTPARKYNPRDGKWFWGYSEYKDEHEKSDNKKKFTKKTSVSLLSPDGVMDLYVEKNAQEEDYGCGLLFDVQAANLKNEKYIIPLDEYNQDAYYHRRWWISGMKGPERDIK